MSERRTNGRVGSGGADRGVGPVIGVVLMIVITAMLAAIVGTMVLDVGQGVDDPRPRVQFSFEYDAVGDRLDVVHQGGESVSEGRVQVVVDGTTYTGAQLDGWSDADGTVTASDRLTIGPGGDLNETLTGGESVRLYWDASDGGQTRTLARYTVPT